MKDDTGLFKALVLLAHFLLFHLGGRTLQVKATSGGIPFSKRWEIAALDRPKRLAACVIVTGEPLTM